ADDNVRRTFGTPPDQGNALLVPGDARVGRVLEAGRMRPDAGQGAVEGPLPGLHEPPLGFKAPPYDEGPAAPVDREARVDRVLVVERHRPDVTDRPPGEQGSGLDLPETVGRMPLPRDDEIASRVGSNLRLMGIPFR